MTDRGKRPLSLNVICPVCGRGRSSNYHKVRAKACAAETARRNAASIAADDARLREIIRKEKEFQA